MRLALPLTLLCILTVLLPAQTFVFNDFSSVAGIALNGNAAQFGSDLRLTPNVFSQTSSAWWNTPVPVAFGFYTRFSFSMTQPVVQFSNGADGIVFILQNDAAGTSAIGTGGGAMGYGSPANISNCLAIELDTWLSNHPSGITDLSNNEISVHTNGSGPNSEDENLSIGRVSPATTTFLDQQVHTLEILCVPGQLDITLDGVPELSVPYDFFTGGTWILGAGGPVSGPNLIGGTDAYVGFTSATGGDAQNHLIHDWVWVSFGPSGCEAGNVGAGAGGPFDVLTINSSSGGGGRTISVPQFAPITFGMAQPPTNPLAAPFVIFGTLGFPNISDSFAITGLGTFCFTPFFLAPQNPSLFVLADSIDPNDPFALLPSTPAPWSLTLPGGIPSPLDFTLQGGIFHNTVPGIGGLAITNRVQVSIYFEPGARLVATDLGQLTRAIESHAPDSKEVAERLARAALEVGLSPARIIDEALVPGMADVGARFRDNEIFVPEVLVSARAMNAALAVLEPHLAAWGYQPVGRILIGTVHGDIHDIGKNLAAMMLQGAGFEVRDLGVNVSLAKFNRAIEEFRPHIVGMSALLTTTMPQMERNLRKWEELDLRTGFKVIVGGAPLTAAWAAEIGADAYAEDAATGARRALELVSEPRQAD